MWFFVAVLFAAADSGFAQKYSVVDLGPFTNSQSTVNAINNSGQVAGGLMFNGVYRAGLYGGSWTNLGNLGGSSSFGLGLNDALQVVGRSRVTNSTLNHAFLWTPGGTDGIASNPQMKDLGTLGGGAATADGINASGQIAGYSQTASEDHAYRYSGGTMFDIGTLLPNNHWSYGYGINDAGHVVGTDYVGNFNSSSAFRYNGGSSITVLAFPGWTFTYGLAINNNDQIVGYISKTVSLVTIDHAFRHSSSDGFVDLGTLGGNFSYANSINNSNVIVGLSTDASNTTQYAFICTNSTLVNLNNLLDDSGAGWVLNNARAINDSGQITGLGTLNGFKHAFLLTRFPPSITNQPSSQSVALSSSVTFTVGVTGTTPLSYQWRFNGTNLAGATTNFYTLNNAQLTNAGDYTILVTNNYGAVTSAVATLIVIVPNAPPTISAIGNQTVDEDMALGPLAFTIGDTETTAGNLTITASSSNVTLVANGQIQITGTESNRSLTITPATNQFGSTLITLTVTDTDGASSSTNFLLTVQAVNDTPILAPLADQVVSEGSTLALTNVASDVEQPAQTLTFSLISGPTGATNDPVTGVLTWTPDESQGDSTNIITVAVTDNGVPSLSATQNFTVIVQEVNTTPVFTLSEAPLVDELTPLNFNVTAADPDIPTNMLAFELVAGPSGLTVSPDGGIAWTPGEDQGPSTNDVTVRVFDNGIPSLSATQNFTVVVQEVNTTPSLAPVEDQTIYEGITFTLTNVATDIDLPVQPLTFSLLSAPSGMTNDSVTGVITWTPPESESDTTNVVTVVVTDNSFPSLSATQSFAVVVQKTNGVPVLSLPATQTVDELTPLNVTAAATDVDIPSNSLTFELVAGPAGLTVSPVGEIAWTPTEEQGPSTNEVMVRVFDDGIPSLSTTQSFTVIVSEVNTTPTLSPLVDQSLDEGNTLTFTNVASDADLPAQTLTFSLVSAPAGATNDPVTGVFTWTPDESQAPSTNVILVVVTDDGVPSLNATQSFTVVVQEVNATPILTLPSAPTVDELTPLNVTATATDADVPANSLTFERVAGPSGLTVSPGGAISWTPTEEQGATTNDVTVRVFDNGVPSLSATQSFTVIVQDVNAFPTLTLPPTQTLDELTPLNVQATASDPDIPTNSLAFELVSGPAGLTVSPGGSISWTPGEDQGPGTNLVAVRVFDDGVPSLSTTQTFTVIVLEVNTAPTLAPIADQFVNEGHLLMFTNFASDFDLPAQALTFALINPPPGATNDPVTGVFTWVPEEAPDNTTNTIMVVVSDAGVPSLSATQTFTVIVDKTNNAPVLTVPTNQTVDELTALNVQATATDPDLPTNSIVIELVSGPSGLTFAPDGAITWTPTEEQGPSTNEVTIQVFDNGVPSLSATQSFTVIVREVNTAPDLTPVADQSLGEGSTLSLTNIASDADAPAQGLTFSLISAPPGATNDPVTGVFTWTPDESQGPSTNTIFMVVTDNGVPSLSATQSFTAVVHEVNAQPALAAVAGQTITEGSTFILTNVASDVDLPAQALTFSLATAPAGATNDPDTGVFAWTPTELQGDTTNFVTVVVTDNGVPSLSATQSFTIIVQKTNSVPVLTLPATQTLDELTPLSVNAAATDSDLPTNMLVFELVAGPTGLTVSPSGEIAWTPAEDQGPGTNDVTIRVFDDGVPSLSTTQSFTVIVHEVNMQPVLAAVADQTVTEGSTLILTNFASDVDLPAQALTFSLVTAPTGATNDPVTGVFAWTPTELQGDTTNLITVVVTDNGIPSLSATQSFTVVVQKTNSAPVLTLPATQTVDELSPLNVSATATDADVPTNTLTFELVAGPAGLSVSPDGAIVWMPVEDQGPSTNDVMVRAFDNGIPSLSTTQSFTVVVQEVNTPPTLAPVADQTIYEGSTLVLTNMASDADLPAQTLTFSLISGPTGATNDPVTGVFTWTPDESQGPSTNTVVVAVTDNGFPSLSATQTFTVVVQEANTVPLLTLPETQVVDELTALNVQAFATDGDVPTNTLVFELLAGPAGLTVSPEGDIAWTPTEAQGPGTNEVTVRVFDNGIPSLSATQSFTVAVNEVNVPPVFTPALNLTVHQGMTINVALMATDADIPANLLTYTLADAPVGADLNQTNGLFSWTPAQDQADSTNLITSVVTDDGVPSLSATNSFTITVVSAPIIKSIVLMTNGFDLTWSSIAGISYRLEYKTNLADTEWISLPGDVMSVGVTATNTDATSISEQRYYRVRLLP